MSFSRLSCLKVILLKLGGREGGGRGKGDGVRNNRDHDNRSRLQMDGLFTKHEHFLDSLAYF